MLRRKNKPAILLEDASIYQQKHLILNRVNMKIEKGELVYFVGKTGSGKSSLMKTLYAQLPLLSGKATVAGIELHKLPWRKVPNLRRKLGIIFQDFNLLNDRTVQENLFFVMEATGWKNKKYQFGGRYYCCLWTRKCSSQNHWLGRGRNHRRNGRIPRHR